MVTAQEFMRAAQKGAGISFTVDWKLNQSNTDRVKVIALELGAGAIISACDCEINLSASGTMRELRCSVVQAELPCEFEVR